MTKSCFECKDDGELAQLYFEWLCDIYRHLLGEIPSTINADEVHKGITEFFYKKESKEIR